MSKKNFTFRIEENAVEYVKKQAEKSGVSLNAFVENALTGASDFKPATLQSLDSKLDQILTRLEASTSPKPE